MSLWFIAWRNIQQRSLASSLTALSMALGVALVAAVLVIHGVIERSFRRGAQGYDLVVGPKGSPMQLVLNTVYYLGEPVGKIPYEHYMELISHRFQLPDGRVAPPFAKCIPVCMGGSYLGFPLVGTTPEFFELSFMEGQHYEFTQHGGQGRNMEIGNFWEAVIGPTVAKAANLKVGDQFQPRHTTGIEEECPEEHHPFTVVGIFAPTGTPNDRAIFVNIEGFWRMHEHRSDPSASPSEVSPRRTASPDPADGAASHSQPQPSSSSSQSQPSANGSPEQSPHHAPERFISAVLIRLDESDPTLNVALPRLIEDYRIGGVQVFQAVHPSVEVAKLLEGIIGNVQLVLLILAVLVVVVAGVGILVSIYNSMNERKRDIAIMRALGASRLTVMMVILLESILLSLGGGAVGVVMSHGLIGLLAPIITEHTGVQISALHFQISELVLIPGLVILASIVGYLPAVAAYRTDVAKALAASP
ncbi:MAG: ABC transporter permease [Thermoguttaceae bacterium]|nr:ABC transporter permease [Thermoguttaceae bacterium]MDW8039707.1 ABC transporter permease [Thermoguttaceae bacterium]